MKLEFKAKDTISGDLSVPRFVQTDHCLARRLFQARRLLWRALDRKSSNRSLLAVGARASR